MLGLHSNVEVLINITHKAELLQSNIALHAGSKILTGRVLYKG
jgi:hypothetical protein